jgi:hypothetical protein
MSGGYAEVVYGLRHDAPLVHRSHTVARGFLPRVWQEPYVRSFRTRGRPRGTGKCAACPGNGSTEYRLFPRRGKPCGVHEPDPSASTVHKNASNGDGVAIGRDTA